MRYIMKRNKRKDIPEITLDINKLSHDGRGIASMDGKTTFVHGALAGEKVLCKITYQHRRYNEGKVVDIIKSADERYQPECQHFGTCGGCSLQHMSISHQLLFKQQTLLEQLAHFGNIKPEMVLPPLSGNPYGYRGKARLGARFVTKKNKLLVGFREKFSNYLADIEHCPVLHPGIGTRLTDLAQLIATLTEFANIPQIEVAVGDQVTALVFRHLTALTDSDINKLRDFGRVNSFDIYLHPNPPNEIRKIWPDDQQHKLTYQLQDYGIEIQFHPLDFTQVNSEMNPLMIKQALHLLEIQHDETLLDLFCGLGNFTLPIARYAKVVTGIEGSEHMVKNATANALHNHIYNTQFYAANLMKPNEHEHWMQQTYDKILLDPPRTGAKEIIPYFKKFAAKKIVYVSCNPATLARDAGELVHQLGYRLKKVGIINMFPHTSHIEAMALFEK